MEYINNGEKTLKEFLQEAKLYGYEIFTADVVKAFQSDFIAKSKSGELDEDERLEKAVELNDLKKQIVVNDDLTKSLLFYREPLVEWIDKAQRTGRYADNATNRRLHRVGQPYKRREGNDVGKEERVRPSKKEVEYDDLRRNLYHNIEIEGASEYGGKDKKGHIKDLAKLAGVSFDEIKDLPNVSNYMKHGIKGRFLPKEGQVEVSDVASDIMDYVRKRSKEKKENLESSPKRWLLEYEQDFEDNMGISVGEAKEIAKKYGINLVKKDGMYLMEGDLKDVAKFASKWNKNFASDADEYEYHDGIVGVKNKN